MSAPTLVTLYMDAKHKESEYAGRPHIGEKEKHSTDEQIPKVKYNVNATTNALSEE